MSKQTPKLEWIVAESEADWERLSAQPSSVNNAVLYRKRTWWSSSALLLLLVGISGWLWHTDSASSQPPVAVNPMPAPLADAFLATRVISDVQTTLWGPEHNLETTSFVFHFHQKDRQTVSAVAPQIEALYTTLHRNFGLLLTLGGEKQVIEVSVTHNPGYATHRFDVADPLIVPSPARYLAPVALSDDQLLAQSIALPLLDSVMAQVVAQNGIRAAWQPLRNGLHLWQLWDLHLPLATWRHEVVTWLYLDVPTTRTAQPVVLPKHYATLCAMHRLWLPRPWQLGIPLRCAGLDQGEFYRAWWSQRQPPIRLAQLGLPVPADADREIANRTDSVSYPGQTVVLATLVEYAVATYGRDRLPALMAGLGQYDSWETLIPAVYGVSPAEFEAGWQAHLAAQVGVSAIDR